MLTDAASLAFWGGVFVLALPAEGHPWVPQCTAALTISYVDLVPNMVSLTVPLAILGCHRGLLWPPDKNGGAAD